MGEDQARIGVALYREIVRRLHVVPWRRRDKTIAAVFVLFALANLFMNAFTVFVGH